MAAVICVLGPLSVPIGEVPIAFANLAIYLAVCLLGWKWGTVSTLVYLLVGLVGAPVFAGYLGGVGRLVGPTGGYLVGYLPMALIAGWAIDATEPLRQKGRRALVWVLRLLGMAAGTAVLYLLGTVWFCLLGGHTVRAAMGLCVTPFIPFDLIKMVAALSVGGVLRDRLVHAGFIPVKPAVSA
jgi:biotin transport system substrate-specific component